MLPPRRIVALVLVLLAVGLAWGQAKKPGQPTITAKSGQVQSGPKPSIITSGPTATPATVTLNAVNPDTTPAVIGTATYQWSSRYFFQGTTNWTLKVSAPANFAGCTSIPNSAVTVTCASASGSGCGGDAASCAAGGPLNSTGVLVAQGTTAGSFFCSDNFAVTLNYTFADNWKYTAGSCNLQLTYSLVGP